MTLLADRYACADRKIAIQIFHVIIFHRNTAIRPVLISVNNIIIIRPGAMNTDAATNSCICRYFAPYLSFPEFFVTLFCRVIKSYKTIPLVMSFFRYDMKTSFRCAAVSFHFFITKAIVSKYHGICGEPAFIIIYIEFIIRFVNDQVNSTYRKYFSVPCYNSLFGF